MNGWRLECHSIPSLDDRTFQFSSTEATLSAKDFSVRVTMGFIILYHYFAGESAAAVVDARNMKVS